MTYCAFSGTSICTLVLWESRFVCTDYFSSVLPWRPCVTWFKTPWTINMAQNRPLCRDCCLCLALRTPSGACQKRRMFFMKHIVLRHHQSSGTTPFVIHLRGSDRRYGQHMAEHCYISPGFAALRYIYIVIKLSRTYLAPEWAVWYLG